MRRLLVSAACAAAFISSASSAVIYSNLVTGGTYWNYGPGSNYFDEAGDLVQFVGSERTLQSVTFWLACGVNPWDGGEVDIIYRIRAIDTTTGLPGDVLSQASQRLVYNTQNFKVNMLMPSIELPNE